MSIKNAMTYSGSAGITTGLTMWGLGNYNADGSLLPELYYASTDNDWDYVSLGSNFGLAIKAGKLYSWGEGASYQTGQGSTADLYEPTQVGSETDWWMISAGFSHSLGIRKTFNVDHYDYTLWVWGLSTSYQTGTGSTTAVQTPTQIGTDTDWESISAGYIHSCAIKNGMLYTCGANGNYRTGQNTSAGSTTTWTSYDSSTGWTKCAGGFDHSIGIKDGEIWGFGEAGNYALGNNNTTDIQVPTQVNASTNWVSVYAGLRYGFAINTSGELYGAGTNTGSMGTGDTTTLQSWTQIGTDTDWESISVHPSSSSTTAAIKSGKLYVCGNNTRGQCGVRPSVSSSYTTFQQIGSGTNYVSVSIAVESCMAIRKT